MRKIQFESNAFVEYQQWIKTDRKIAAKIGELIMDIVKNPFAGLGKPEPLKGDYQGYWSRRINEEHRLLYKVTDTFVTISSCYSHYNKK